MGFNNKIGAQKAWETRWAKKNKKIFDYEPTIKEKEKVLKNKNKERALKAWETRRKRKNEIIKKESYYRPKKNLVRNDIFNIISKMNDKSLNILTLDTKEYLFSKEMKNHNVFLAQNNKKEYLRMLENKPDNVFLHYGDIAQLSSLVTNFDIIYLDFCCSLKGAIPTILRLVKKIDNSKIFGFTFCLRKNSKELEDYKFDLINKLQELVGTNIKVIYGKAYRDKKQAPMITIFFENIKDKYNQYLKNELYDQELSEWAINKIIDLYPHIWSPHQLFDYNAKTILSKCQYNNTIIEDIFLLALKENKIHIPVYYSEGITHSENGYKGLYNYFETLLFRTIWRLWKRKFIDDNINFYEMSKKNYCHTAVDIHLVHNIKQIKECVICTNKKGYFKINKNNYCEEHINEFALNLEKEIKEKVIIKKGSIANNITCKKEVLIANDFYT